MKTLGFGGDFVENMRKYVAFISYRHKPLDILLAERLRIMLERYVVDEEFRTDPKEKHLGLVFRDRDELPLSDDLTEDIYKALDNSQFLIVICTNETPKSLWVQREIQYFTSRHGHDRVLTVLAQDPPELSFPEQVTHVKDAEGNVIEIIEPLAAYVAGKNRLHSLWKLQREFLRLVAAILGRPYGEIMQRQKRYRQRQIMAGLLVTVAVAAGFIGMLLNRNAQINAQNTQIRQQNQQITEKNAQIEEKNQQIQLQLEASQKNESQALSLLSAQKLLEGDRRGAIRDALTALPSAEVDRPYCAEAEYALANALYAYSDTDMRFDLKITQNSDIYTLAIADSGDYAVTLDLKGGLRCYDLHSGAERWRYQMTDVLGYAEEFTDSNFSVLRIVEQQQTVVVGTRFCTWVLSLENGECLHRIQPIGIFDTILSEDGQLLVGHDYNHIYENGEWAKTENTYTCYDLTTGEALGSCSYTGPGKWSYGQYAVSRDHTKLAFSLVNWDQKVIEVFVVDTQTGEELLYHRETFQYTHNSRFPFIQPFGEIDQVSLQFLPDDSLLLYYAWKSEETNRGTVYTTRVAMDGQVVYQTQKQVSVAASFIDEAIITCFQNEKYCFFVHPTFLVRIEMDRPNVVSVYDIVLPSGSLASDARENIAGYYLVEDTVLIVYRDGTIERCGYLDYDHPDCSFPVSTACGVGIQTDVLGVVSAEDPTSVYFVRLMGDHNRSIYENEEDNAWYYIDGGYTFPSGDRFLFLDGKSEKNTWFYRGTVRNGAGEVLDSFEFTFDSVLNFCGFSADETCLILNGYVYDLKTHTLALMEDFRRVYDGNNPTIVTHSTPVVCWKPGKPVLTVYLDESDRSIHWWLDGKNLQSAVLPENLILDYRTDSNWDDLTVGGNGLAVRRNAGVTSGSTGTFLIFSTKTQQWRSLDNPHGGSPVIAMAEEKPWIAFADFDNMLRVYDFDEGKVIRQLPMAADYRDCTQMQFLMEDTVLMLKHGNGRCVFLSAEDGTLLGQFTVEDYNKYSDLQIYVDAQRNILYLCDAVGYFTGYRIDMSQWKPIARIPRAVCWIPGDNRIVGVEGRKYATISRVYDTEGLIGLANDILEGNA